MDVPDLARRAAGGDVDAFTELVRRYQAMAHGYAWARLGDPHLAEDVAQQAFIAAWRNLPTLRQPERFGGWLQRIVQFECAHHLRRRRLSSQPLEHARHAATDDDPVDRSERREAFERALAAVYRLPQPEREVTILYYIHDQSQREVASFLNLPVDTVNNRLRSARALLKEGHLLTMTDDARNDHKLPDGFAARIGEIIRAEGHLLDARFPTGQRPRVLNALTVTDDSSAPAITVEAIQYLDDDIVRCIALTGDAFELRPGMAIADSGGPISIPLTDAAIHQVISALRATAPGMEIAETGIKPIDLLAPLPRRGTVALVGDMQTGKIVLVEELIQRLAAAPCEISVIVFIETRDEVVAIRELEYRTSARVEAVYLPVADPSPETLAEVTADIDTVITFNRVLAGRGLWPAIDPLRSRSRLLDPSIAGADHRETAARVREMLTLPDDRRAEALRQFLTQPFYVAEPFTNRPGASVPLADTIAGCRALLDGPVTDVDPEALYMTGPLPGA